MKNSAIGKFVNILGIVALGLAACQAVPELQEGVIQTRTFTLSNNPANFDWREGVLGSGEIDLKSDGGISAFNTMDNSNWWFRFYSYLSPDGKQAFFVDDCPDTCTNEKTNTIRNYK